MTAGRGPVHGVVIPLRVLGRALFALLVAGLGIVAVPATSWATTWTGITTQGYVAPITDSATIDSTLPLSCTTNSCGTVDVHNGSSTGVHGWLAICSGSTGTWTGAYVAARTGSNGGFNNATTLALGCTAPQVPLGMVAFANPTDNTFPSVSEIGSSYTSLSASSYFAGEYDVRPGNPNTAPPLPAWCTSAAWSDLAAGYAAGQLSVRFKWSGTVPSGWSVEAPTGSTLGTLPASAAVDGSPGYYAGKFTLGSVPATVKLTAPSNAEGAPGCSVTLTSVKPTDVAPGGSTYGATDPDTSADCGLNPFCYIKAALRWAFVPPAGAMQQWHDYADDVLQVPPFSLVSSGVPYVTSAWGYLRDNGPTDGSCATLGGEGCPAHLGAGGSSSDPTGGAIDIDLLSAAGDLVQDTDWLMVMYHATQGLVWIFTLHQLWGMTSASFGGRGGAE